MLARSRVGRGVDVGRMAAAVSRPGIDPRLHTVIAFATAESVVTEDGHFVDVVLAPSGKFITCRVADSYAGVGYGSFSPIHVDDELAVNLPDGDEGHGGMVVARAHSTSDPLPQEVMDNPADVAEIIENDVTLRIVTHGSGKSYFNSDTKVVIASPHVNLGAEDPDQQAINGTNFRTAQETLDSSWQVELGVAAAGELAASVAATAMAASGALMATAGAFMLIPIAGAMIAGPFITAAGALFTAGFPALAAGHVTVQGADDAIAADVGTFEGQASEFLSNSVSLTT